MATNLADASSDFISISADLTVQVLKLIENYVSNSNLSKQILKDFKFITNSGKETPIFMSWSRENTSYVAKLIKMIDEHNLTSTQKEHIGYLKLNNQAGTTILMTNEKGQKIMEKMQLEILAKENIKAPECTDRYFLNKHDGEPGILFKNLDPNTFELIKEKHWMINTKEELQDRFSSDFFAIPNKGNTKDIVISEHNSLQKYNPGSSIQKSGTIDNLFYANAVLAGKSGKNYQSKMNYERSIMSKLSKLYLTKGKFENKDSVLYVTSRTSRGKYLEYKNDSFTIHQVGFSKNGPGDIPIEVKKEQGETSRHFLAKAMKEFSSLSNPVILGGPDECIEHLFGEKPLTKCLTTEGENIKCPTAILASESEILKAAKALNELVKIQDFAAGKSPDIRTHFKNCSEMLNNITEEKSCPVISEDNDRLNDDFKKRWKIVKTSITDISTAMSLTQTIAKCSEQIDSEQYEINHQLIRLLQERDKTISKNELSRYYSQVSEEMTNLDFNDIYNKSMKNALLDNSINREIESDSPIKESNTQEVEFSEFTDEEEPELFEYNSNARLL